MLVVQSESKNEDFSFVDEIKNFMWNLIFMQSTIGKHTGGTISILVTCMPLAFAKNTSIRLIPIGSALMPSTSNKVDVCDMPFCKARSFIHPQSCEMHCVV